MDSVTATSREALESSIASATQGAARLPATGRPLGVRARSRQPPSPRNMCCCVHYLAEPVDSASSKAKIANYLRRIQGDHGGWPLVHDGAFDMSASVKAYFALKMIGDSVGNAPHMVRAREAIRVARRRRPQQRLHPLHAGDVRGASDLARVPVLPVEIMLLPRWFPFHINKISYWARTTIVPLLVLAALKPRARNPKRRRYRRALSWKIHAFDRHDPRRRRIKAWGWFVLFRALDVVLRDHRAAGFQRAAPAQSTMRVTLDHRRAAQRRGRPRRDLSAHGQQRDDVRGVIGKPAQSLSAARVTIARKSVSTSFW